MTRVGIIGATGYAGVELVRILHGHPHVTLSTITSRQYAGTAISAVFPSLTGVVDIQCEAFSPDETCERADVLFTALPHHVSMAIVPELVRRGRRVIDLSADFRFRNVNLYEAHYQPHSARELSEQAVYGLSEVFTEAIRSADLVGNPGCYPTSVLLPLIPLVSAGMLDPGSLIADAKSGVSGAGRSPALTSLYCEVAESFKAYKIGVHRHNPEMNEVLSAVAGRPLSITFVPHLVPLSRGMLTTIYASPCAPVTEEEIRDVLARYYEGRPFIRLRPTGGPPNTLHVRGTNYCDIGCKVDAGSGRIILISAIDNLVKGAAGQAVQNMNLMLGLPEDCGLNGVPFAL